METKLAKYTVYPYSPHNRKLFPEDILERFYDDLEAQSCEDIGGTTLLRELLHENPMTKNEFVDFLNTCVLCIFVDQPQNKYAGFGWVTDVVQTETHLRGFGAFVFHREYWNQQDSLEYGKIFVWQLFNCFGFDQLWAITPEPNRLSRLWSTRLGFKYLPVSLPGFTTYHGERCDAKVCFCNRDEFNAKWGLDGDGKEKSTTPGGPLQASGNGSGGDV